MTGHSLKTWPKYFQAVFDGKKTFEIRKNDRGFKVGDTMVLHEWDPKLEIFTGRKIFADITYILDSYDVLGVGIRDGYCAIGFRIISLK